MAGREGVSQDPPMQMTASTPSKKPPCQGECAEARMSARTRLVRRISQKRNTLSILCEWLCEQLDAWLYILAKRCMSRKKGCNETCWKSFCILCSSRGLWASSRKSKTIFRLHLAPFGPQALAASKPASHAMQRAASPPSARRDRNLLRVSRET
jgi:hypothetical protein